MSEHEVLDDPAVLDELVEAVLADSHYAIDTEFHREKTYFPRVALVQIGWSGGVALIDPLAVDISPLARLFDSDATAVLHAADQDLEVFQLECGTVPSTMFDTQIAAGFLGMATPSLAALHERWLGLTLPKGDRLTDWLARPLRESQLDYAASDVSHLLELHGRLVAALEERGRREWVDDECELSRSRDRSGRDPDEAWRRIKEVRQLRGKKLSVARSIAAWRERRAVEVDQPPRFVLPDLAVVSISQRLPKNADSLRKGRGVDSRYLRNGAGEAILQAVRDGLQAEPPPARSNRAAELDRGLRPAITLVSAWVSQLARDLEIDTAILATRSDIEAFLRGDDDARLATGWRADVAGAAVRRLVDGDAALAFDGKGGLLLEDRVGHN